MAKRPRSQLSSRALREAASVARKLTEQAVASRSQRAAEDHPLAAAVAQRVYHAAVEAERTGESGDISPAIWAPLAVAAEMMAPVVIKANDLPDDDETLIDVAAYFVAGFLSGGHGFDVEHFKAWQRRSSADDADAMEPG